MIYYVNWALLIVFVVFFALQLKHNGKVTQKHLTGDWRQKLHSDGVFLVDLVDVDEVSLILSGFIVFSGPILIFAGWYWVFCGFFIFCVINFGKIILPDYIYYNPEGKYVLLKNNSSGEYSIKKLDKHPGKYGVNLYNIQILGYKKLSQFESEVDILYHTSLLSDDKIIKDLINTDTIYKILINKESKITNAAYTDKVKKLLDILYKKEWAKPHIESSLEICSERYPVYFFNEFSGWDEDWSKPYIKNIRDAMMVYDLRTRGLPSNVLMRMRKNDIGM